MAEITRKRSGELVRGVFRILLDNPDGLAAKDLLKRLEEAVPPTAFEGRDYPNRPGVRRYEKIVRFATIPTAKAGWLLKRKGVWSLTEEGGQAFREFGDPERFLREALRLYKKWKSDQPETESEDLEEAEASDSTAGATLEEAEENAWREVEDYLTSMPPYDFQQLVGALLTGMGYHVAWIAPPGKDGGIDILAHTDPLGTRGPRIKVQVKRQQAKISVDGLRSFMAVLGDQDVGLFVSTGGFTKDAEVEARQQEKRQVTLVDLARLFDLWIEHYEEIEEAERSLLPLRPIYYLAPTD